MRLRVRPTTSFWAKEGSGKRGTWAECKPLPEIDTPCNLDNVLFLQVMSVAPFGNARVPLLLNLARPNRETGHQAPYQGLAFRTTTVGGVHSRPRRACCCQAAPAEETQPTDLVYCNTVSLLRASHIATVQHSSQRSRPPSVDRSSGGVLS